MTDILVCDFCVSYKFVAAEHPQDTQVPARKRDVTQRHPGLPIPLIFLLDTHFVEE